MTFETEKAPQPPNKEKTMIKIFDPKKKVTHISYASKHD